MKSSKKKLYEKPIFNQKGILSSSDMICCCINSAVGLGVLKLGVAFTSGLLISFLLLVIICFLSFYSYKLLVLSASVCHQSTFEEIWKVQFSKKTIFIPVCFTVITTLLSIVNYIREIQSYTITIFSKIYFLATDKAELTVLNLKIYKMLVGCAAFVSFLIPVCFVTHLKTITKLSYISNFFLILFTIYIIIMFGYEVKHLGFDPDHSFKLFHFKGHITRSLSTTIFAFNFHPLAYPGIRNVINSTKSNLSNIFRNTMIIVLVYYLIVGTFSYLTFFDKNKSGVILDYYPENTKTEKILTIIGRIITLVFILFTVPHPLNACRYVILNLVSDVLVFPEEIWRFTGIIISLLALCLANLTEKYLNILFTFSDAMASFFLFVFTPLFYLKINGLYDRFNAFMSILLLLIGAMSTIFSILNNES
ncbi:hypothetical protein M9Y10_029830 [Tritrichomonas musculus]|uniref:Amino acid transporter transmembrane domain-containing protein n=1 Tax=Tritrichomonas musculus TaxID=1915356 RepID=A0ABR2KP31_9EUKA